MSARNHHVTHCPKGPLRPQQRYECLPCCFTTVHKSNYERHVVTSEHHQSVIATMRETEINLGPRTRRRQRHSGRLAHAQKLRCMARKESNHIGPMEKAEKQTHEEAGNLVVQEHEDSRIGLCVKVKRTCIHCGDRIGVYGGRHIESYEQILALENDMAKSERKTGHKVHNYLFSANCGSTHLYIDGACSSGVMKYVNHCCVDANAEADVEYRMGSGHQIVYRALRTIDVGEEITISYNSSPEDMNFVCVCNSCRE